MADSNGNVDNHFLSTKRYAVVTGANRGIGLEICRQLASKGVTVVLTSRDEFRGMEAIRNLKNEDNSISEFLEFHQLDVVDPCSVASAAEFVKSKFGKLDILVNNAGITGSQIDSDAFIASVGKGKEINYSEIITGKYELGVECLETNYYGCKRLTEVLLPILQLSDSARIVNITSRMGAIQAIPNERDRQILYDVENLTEEKIDAIMNEFLEDLKNGELKSKGWPSFLAPYTVSKAAMNAYTRMTAKKHPNVDINCVCPGYVKTDINYHTGVLSVEEGAASAVRLALLPKGQASGAFFKQEEASPF